MMRAQLSYLDLVAFYESAKSLRDWTAPRGAGVDDLDGFVGTPKRSVVDLCDKLMCVIDAIRSDGLDPRWNPERDALQGLWVGLSPHDPTRVERYQISGVGAEDLIRGLHERGYKIVKNEPNTYPPVGTKCDGKVWDGFKWLPI